MTRNVHGPSFGSTGGDDKGGVLDERAPFAIIVAKLSREEVEVMDQPRRRVLRRGPKKIPRGVPQNPLAGTR